MKSEVMGPDKFNLRFAAELQELARNLARSDYQETIRSVADWIYHGRPTSSPRTTSH